MSGHSLMIVEVKKEHEAKDKDTQKVVSRSEGYFRKTEFRGLSLTSGPTRAVRVAPTMRICHDLSQLRASWSWRTEGEGDPGGPCKTMWAPL